MYYIGFVVIYVIIQTHCVVYWVLSISKLKHAFKVNLWIVEFVCVFLSHFIYIFFSCVCLNTRIIQSMCIV